jgi:phosphoglycerate dehydrogenase-like enzyme
MIYTNIFYKEGVIRMKNKPICFVDIAMHQEAEKILEGSYQIIRKNDPAFEKAELSAAIVYGISDEWINDPKFNRIRAIGCHSCSSNIKIWATEKNIKIIMANSLWRTVAEHTLALFMAAARNIPQADLDIRRGIWNNHVDLKIKHSGFDFQNKVMGIWGMGQIGKELAEMLKGFNMKILYNDLVKLPSIEEDKLNINFCPFEQLLQESDYFCILIPLNDDTKGIMNKQAFSKLKKGCIFVNTARADIVNERDFLDALDNHIIASAALDVLWKEAMLQDRNLLNRYNLILTPHLGGSTFECDMVLVNGIISNN